MCEIAVFNPEKHNITTVQQAAGTFFSEQEDGLGVVMVKDRGDHFEYETYKSTQPHWTTLWKKLRRHYEDTYRVVVHGRAATSGKVNRQTAHPIRVDCDCTDFEYVVHNGSVRDHRQIRPRLREEGHTINTEVDSELIAHEVQDIPDDIDSLTYSSHNLRGNLNYLLFSPDGIFVRMSRRYHVTDDFTLTCRPKEFESIDGDPETRWMVVHPGGDTDISKSITSGTTSGNRKWYGQGNSTVAGTGGTARTKYTGYGETGNDLTASEDGREGDDDTYTITYQDLIPRISRVSAIKPAPGVVRIIDHKTHETTYVYEDEDPETYYYYLPNEEPDEAEEVLDVDRDELLDGVPDYVREASRDAWEEAIAAEADLTMAEAADIADEVDELLPEDNKVHG